MRDSFIKLYIRKLGINGFYDQKQNHEEDSGFDLYVPYRTYCPARKVTFIKHGIECEMIRSDYDKFINKFVDVNIPFLLTPRSSISKTPLIMANSIGIIDKGYRGEIIAAVYNTSDDDYEIEQGTRLFQIISPTLTPFSISLTEELSASSRGAGGFGSTGK